MWLLDSLYYYLGYDDKAHDETNKDANNEANKENHEETHEKASTVIQRYAKKKLEAIHNNKILSTKREIAALKIQKAMIYYLKLNRRLKKRKDDRTFRISQE